MTSIGWGILLCVIVIFVLALFAKNDQPDPEYIEDQMRRGEERGYDR